MRDDCTKEKLAGALARANAMNAVLGGSGSRKDVSDFAGTRSRPSRGHDLRDRREALQEKQDKAWGFDRFGNMVQQDIPLTRSDVEAMMPDFVRRHMPQPLKGLLETTFDVGIDPLEMVATMQTNGSAAWTKGGVGGGGTWTGVWWFAGVKKSPIYITDADNIEGCYVKIHLGSGELTWADTVSGDTDTYEYFDVADKDTSVFPAVYTLNNHTQGDIHVTRD
jgi:hypothetical protein